MVLTTEQFKTLFPRTQGHDSWVRALNDILPRYEIHTAERLAAFLAQCGHESAGFTVFEENLNYSEQSLMRVFGKYFPNRQLAAQYARKPEKIANRVYANRMSNGDEASGDGWKYRGRGPIQLTGKANYIEFGQDMFEDADNIVQNPDWVLADMEISILSAVWFWNKRNLNYYADRKDMRTMTRIINGGNNGLEDRLQYYEKATRLLDENIHRT